MGNASSTSTSSSEEKGSGMFLTAELQGKINSEFESLLLESEWKNYTTAFLQRHNQRQTDYALHAAETNAKMDQLQAQAKQVHDKLDELLNDAKSKIAGLELELSHDVDRLSKRFDGSPASSERLCMDDRVKLSRCFNTLGDIGECQVFAKKLEKCVTDALASA
ncbi:hypothetical protein HJC23_006301 [Cyclotella cryptica]|uniref:Uncharacterized protein n=1 Tax=Cyclotella cryptica TaxID=29204 RepID=A0ABD3PDC2_9STRA|eukprot:CCRYP_015784-RA/>CCRYP_015784-RA protein AED:0.36 eAED:0.36 QI:87/1/1/1/1/1/2/288/163